MPTKPRKKHFQTQSLVVFFFAAQTTDKSESVVCEVFEEDFDLITACLQEQNRAAVLLNELISQQNHTLIFHLIESLFLFISSPAVEMKSCTDKIKVPVLK